jgi:signal transduction histidine kinase
MLLDDALAWTATLSAFVRLHDIIARVPGLIGEALSGGGGATGDPAGQSAPARPSVSAVERRRAARRRADEERARLLAQAQEALAQARETQRRAEAAVQARAEFLSSATHDLRVPLTTTMGRAQMVQHSLQAQDAIDQTWLHRQMDALCDASKRMLAAVDEMNDVAGLQMGHALDLDRGPVDVGLVLHTVADDASIQHGPRVVDLEAPVGAMVMGDRLRLERVMHNIVGNAIKYSAGCTPIHVEVSQDDARVTVTVRDRGVGIPADDLPHVFTLFYRASTALGVPGSGIGLAGARTIVEQHGGQVTLQSAVGEGTTVTITLPRHCNA